MPTHKVDTDVSTRTQPTQNYPPLLTPKPHQHTACLCEEVDAFHSGAPESSVHGAGGQIESFRIPLQRVRSDHLTP